MKQTTVLLFILYFLLLTSGVVLFYFKYVRNYTPVKTEALQVNVIDPRSLIYYTQTNILSVIDQNTTDKIPKVETFEVQGELGSLDLNKSKSQIAYEQKNNQSNWEIWQGDFNNIQKEQIAFEDKTKFENFQNFAKPKYSPDMTQLAFLAQGSNVDALFVKNLTTGNLTKINNDSSLKIADYSWDKSSEKLIYCSTNPPSNSVNNACFSITAEGENNTQLFEREVKNISWDKTDDIFYLNRDDTPHLYMVSTNNQDHTQIDDVAAPKKIISFQINPDGKKIIYEITSGEKSDIYLSDINGTNRIQLTTDGNASQPIFSSNTLGKIAFLRQRDGIYAIDLNQTNEQKIINLKETINSLILWR